MSTEQIIKTLNRPIVVVGAIVLVLFVTYTLTAAPGFTFEDTASFAATCSTLGISHPPGYPLYSISCFPLAKIAQVFGMSASKSAIVASSLAAAFAAGVLALLLTKYTKSLIISVAIALAFGLSRTLWSQAVIQEVYALHVLLFALALYFADQYLSSKAKRKLYLLALVIGLGLANHWPLFTLSLPVFILWLVPVLKHLLQEVCSKRFFAYAGFFLLGLSPYLLLLNPPSNAAIFMGAKFPADFFWHIARTQLAGFDAVVQHPRWFERISNGLLSVRNLLGEYTLLGGLVALYGLLNISRTWKTTKLAAMAWGLFGVTFVLAIYRPYLAQAEVSALNFYNYGITATFLLAIALGVGFTKIKDFVKKHKKLILFSKHILFVAFVIPLALFTLNFGKVDRSKDDIAQRYATLVYDELPEDSLLLLGIDNSDFPLAYGKFFQEVPENSEIEVVSLYLDKVGPKPSIDRLYLYLQREDRPVFLSPSVQYNLQDSLVFHGAYFTIKQDANQSDLALTDNARAFLRHLNEYRNNSLNPWTNGFIDQLLFRFVLTAMLIEQADEKSLTQENSLLLDDLRTGMAGRYASFLITLALDVQTIELSEVDKLVEQLGDLSKFPIRWQAEVLQLLASAQLNEGNTEQAINTLQQALDEFPSATNWRVLSAMLGIYASQNDFAKYRKLRLRFPSLTLQALQATDNLCEQQLKISCTR